MVSAPTTGSSLKYSESQMSDRYLKDAFAFDVQWQPYIAGVVTALSTTGGGENVDCVQEWWVYSVWVG